MSRHVRVSHLPMSSCYNRYQVYRNSRDFTCVSWPTASN